MVIKMKVYKIRKGDKFMAAGSLKNIRFVDAEKIHYQWKKEAKSLEVIKNNNLEGCEVVLVEINKKENALLAKKSTKKASPKKTTKNVIIEEDNLKEEKLDENILFKAGFCEKCMKCLKSCKQPKAYTILRCHEFEKIK